MSRTPSGPGARAFESALGAAWVLMIAVTALGHVTALRNTLTVAVSLATIGWFLRDWRAVPCRLSLTSLLLWAVASVLWSTAPDTTLGKLRTDLLIPVVAGIAAFCFVREGSGLRAVIAGLVLGLFGLTVLSAFAYLPPALAPSWALEPAAGIVRPLPHWYPGPGDASMFAILAIAPVTLAYRVAPRSRRSGAAAIAAGAMIAFVLATTNNRNAVLVAPIVVLVHWLLDRRTYSATVVARRRVAGRRVVVAVVASCVVVTLLAALLEIGARQRLEYLHRPLDGGSAAIALASADTRPGIWRYYLARGLEHPWIGMGFGRTVPGIGWRTENDRELARLEPNAYIHAHNTLLNWWLQLGTIGLALVCVTMVDVIRSARRSVAAAGRTTTARRVFHALAATLVATLARNLTDDFLVYGMATTFVVVIGAYLGALSRLARAGGANAAEAFIWRRSRSGPS